MDRHHSRHPSWGSRLINALSDRHSSMAESKGSIFADDRVWYDQFTSTDWVHDAIADSHRVKALRSRKGFLGRLLMMLDGVQGWILSALSGFLIAVVAYTVNVTESTMFDFKDGYCSRKWYLRERVRKPILPDVDTVADWSRLAVLKVCLLAKIGATGPRYSAITRSVRREQSSLSTCVW